jgi:dimeric dUTPase (all-alpha-NTP-PPase superfamily)
VAGGLRQGHDDLDFEGGLELLRHRMQGSHTGVLQVMLDEQQGVLDAIEARMGASDLTESLQMSELADAIMMEAAELKAWLPWKRWKGDFGRDLTDEERAGVLEELVDITHFLLEAFLLAGVDIDGDLGALYLAKAAVNRQRQEEGY